MCIRDSIREILGEKADKATLDSLAAAEKWAIATMLIRNNIDNALHSKSNELFMALSHDVNSWYNAGLNSKLLTAYSVPVRYYIHIDQKYIIQMMKDAMGLFGNDIEFVMSKLLITYSTKSFWAKTKLIT